MNFLIFRPWIFGTFIAEDTLLTSLIEYAILFTYERERSYVNNIAIGGMKAIFIFFR